VNAAPPPATEPAFLPGIPGGGLIPTPDHITESAIKIAIKWFVGSLGDAVASLIGDFFTASTRPAVTASSFLAPGGAYHTVASVSALLLVGCIILGVIQALFSGEPGQAFARLARNVPLAVLALIGFPWLADRTLAVADVVALAVVPSADVGKRLVDVMAFPPSHDIPGLMVTAMVFVGCILVYLELVVRDVLATVVVALAPLSFAAMAAQTARPAAGEVVKLGVAIAFSKPAIFIALRVGTDTLLDSDGGRDPASWGRYVAAMAVLAVAVFMPFLLWKLLPLAEAYALAQGASRAPFRAATQALQTAYWAQATGAALGGRGRTRTPAGAAAAGAGSGGPSGGIPGGPRSLPTPSGGPSGGGGRRTGGAAGPPTPSAPGANPPAGPSGFPPPQAGGSGTPPTGPAGPAGPGGGTGGGGAGGGPPGAPPGWVRRPRRLATPGGAAAGPPAAGG
jgi:hypothetical protein